MTEGAILTPFAITIREKSAGEPATGQEVGTIGCDGSYILMVEIQTLVPKSAIASRKKWTWNFWLLRGGCSGFVSVKALVPFVAGVLEEKSANLFAIRHDSERCRRNREDIFNQRIL